MGFVALILVAVTIYIGFVLISSASNAAKREQWQKEKRAKEEAVKRDLARKEALYMPAISAVVDRLTRSGDVNFYDIYSLKLTCSNGHNYLFGDFHYQGGVHSTTRVESHTEKTTSHVSNSYYDPRHPYSGIRIENDGKVESEKEVRIPVTETYSYDVFGCPLCKSSLYAFDNPAVRNWKFCMDMHEGKGPLFYKQGMNTCPMCVEIKSLSHLKPDVLGGLFV